ncbi:MAG TPA: hypothetical protein VKF41_10030 [Bryobacteraceae bacterium]|nr:hypothetical protein [Bryobacteraceae bacterium]
MPRRNAAAAYCILTRLAPLGRSSAPAGSFGFICTFEYSTVQVFPSLK